MVQHKVFISPSDQTKNTYAAGNTNEAEQCGKIGTACKAALERCGFLVQLVQYEPMSSKCAKSDSFGAELHLPIHSNAFDGKTSGTRLMCMNTSGKGYQACQAIFEFLAPLTPGTSENISAHPELYEIRNPAAPTAYVEVDFHDVPRIAQWIIANTTEIGEAIAKGVCKYFGVTYVNPEVGQNESEKETKVVKRYKTFDDLPDWAKPAIQEIINAGALQGDEKGNIDLSEDMMRVLIIINRYVKKVVNDKI